jgi:hypothetical protein
VPAGGPSPYDWSVGALKGAAVFAMLTGIEVAAALTEPLDVSGNVDLPHRVQQVKQRDGFAYRAHRWLGFALFRLDYPSDAVALQWLKAAGHSRSQSETERAATYFKRARDGAESPAEFDQSICRWVVGRSLNAAQQTVVARSGTRCGV